MSKFHTTVVESRFKFKRVFEFHTLFVFPFCTCSMNWILTEKVLILAKTQARVWSYNGCRFWIGLIIRTDTSSYVTRPQFTFLLPWRVWERPKYKPQRCFAGPAPILLHFLFGNKKHYVFPLHLIQSKSNWKSVQDQMSLEICLQCHLKRFIEHEDYYCYSTGMTEVITKVKL